MPKGLCHYCKSHPNRKGCRDKNCSDFDPILWLFSNITVHPNGCWLLTHGMDKGSGYVRIVVDGKRVAAHRWSYELHHGKIDDGRDILHSCIDARNCINPLHLRQGNDVENAVDKLRQGRQRKWIPEESNLAELTRPEVIKIKIRLKTETVASIARSVNRCYKTVWNIKHFKSWKFDIDGTHMVR